MNDGVLMRLDSGAERLLSESFVAGIESVDFSDYEAPTALSHPVDLSVLREVLDEGMARFGAEADRWLAPLIHFSLRLTRREAGDEDVFRWLGCVFAPDFVRHRFGKTSHQSKATPAARFAGRFHTQAISRLWWGAELFRDGHDYDSVIEAFSYQDIPNNFLRMKLARHRPTALAFARVIRERAEAGGRPADTANALAKAVNSAATTLAIDLVASDAASAPAAIESWVHETTYDPAAFFDASPAGPEDIAAPPQSVEAAKSLLEDLLLETPLRVRGDGDEEGG